MSYGFSRSSRPDPDVVAHNARELATKYVDVRTRAISFWMHNPVGSPMNWRYSSSSMTAETAIPMLRRDLVLHLVEASMSLRATGRRESAMDYENYQRFVENELSNSGNIDRLRVLFDLPTMAKAMEWKVLPEISRDEWHANRRNMQGYTAGSFMRYRAD